MESEIFVRQEADELTALIADRLGERQRKQNLMAEWERGAKTVRWRPAVWALAIAACVAAVVVMVPMWRTAESPLDELGIERPSMTEYRGATSEMERIESLISNERWEEALRRTAKALKASDLAVYELEGIPELYENVDEMVYEEELERHNNSELRWTYIYLLVKTGDTKEARRQLKKYLKTGDYCYHKEEAKLLLEKLKN